MRHMVGGIFYEHGHRLIASGVGFSRSFSRSWIWKAEPRRWMRMLGFAALAAVCLQGLLGGITVLYFLPTPVSTAHAGPGADFLLHDDRHRAVHVARMDGPRRRPPVDDSMLRHGRDDHHRRDLPPDSGRRDDAALGCGAGDSGFPAGVRRIVAARVDGADCDPLRASRRGVDRDARHRGDGRPRLVSPLGARRASAARAPAFVSRARPGDAGRVRHLVGKERGDQHGARRRRRADAGDLARADPAVASRAVRRHAAAAVRVRSRIAPRLDRSGARA